MQTVATYIQSVFNQSICIKLLDGRYTGSYALPATYLRAAKRNNLKALGCKYD
jgi:hypothetical protein